MPDIMIDNSIKLIVLDLDGTLFNSDKVLTQRNRDALIRAAALGIEIVPATGRLVSALSPAVSSLPFLHYVIGSNGAQIFDMQKNEAIARAEIPNAEACEILDYLHTLPVIYDCYMLDRAWMTRSMWLQGDDYAPDAQIAKMIRTIRTPVDDLRQFVRERGCGVQKIQFFAKDLQVRDDALNELSARYPDTSVTSALVNNVEINSRNANKGTALATLADHIGILLEQTMSFGDGLNDISMLKIAGVGVAMGNGCDEAKAAADLLTDDCNHDGVAAVIEQLCEKLESKPHGA